MTASNIDRLATAHVALTNRLLSDSYWYEDFMTGVASLLALAAQSFAAVAVERAERAEASCDVQFKGAAKVQRIRAEQAEQALTADKARADKAEAMLTVAFDTYQAGVENGGYWEHCTYTQWLADLARRRLADLAHPGRCDVCAERDQLRADLAQREATVAILRAHVDDGTELCAACRQAVLDYDAAHQPEETP